MSRGRNNRGNGRRNDYYDQQDCGCHNSVERDIFTGLLLSAAVGVVSYFVVSFLLGSMLDQGKVYSTSYGKLSGTTMSAIWSVLISLALTLLPALLPTKLAWLIPLVEFFLGKKKNNPQPTPNNVIVNNGGNSGMPTRFVQVGDGCYRPEYQQSVSAQIDDDELELSDIDRLVLKASRSGDPALISQAMNLSNAAKAVRDSVEAIKGE